MGSFSFTRAEHTTKRANIALNDSYKILIPKKFGGGYIKDKYYDYGLVFHNTENHIWVDDSGNKHVLNNSKEADLYGILAYWNKCDDMQYEGNDYPSSMDCIINNGNTAIQKNRSKGINLYSGSIAKINTIKYPLKLVSASYKGTYEDCCGRSYDDLSQGCSYLKWTSTSYNCDEILEQLINAEKNKSK